MKFLYSFAASVLLIVFSSITVNAQSLTPFTIGTIAPGDSVVIYYDVTINNSLPPGTTKIGNQGVVSGTGFTMFSTDDPDTGPTGDSTFSLLNMFPLPVMLTELRAAPKAGGVEVAWQVASESNMQVYEVERSGNGRSFQKLGEKASLNRSTGSSYQFLDPSPSGSVNYYRLRLIDRSSAVSYSAVVKVDLSGKGGTVSLYPNPVVQRLMTLQLSNMERGSYELLLYTASGQLAYRQTIRHDGGSATRSILVPQGLSKGLYSVQLSSQKSEHKQLVLIQ